MPFRVIKYNMGVTTMKQFFANYEFVVLSVVGAYIGGGILKDLFFTSGSPIYNFLISVLRGVM